MRCVVLNCINATAASDKLQDICFFKFPKKADLAKRWLSFCGNKDALKVKNASICINHFKEEDIVGAERFKLGLAKHISLGLNAVPCINLKLLDELLADVVESEETYVSPPPPTEEFQTIPHEDCPEGNVDESNEADENHESLTQFNKCRTCYRDYEFDLNDEDPFDNANSVLLCRIEVICGVWLSNIEGGPRYMCPDCQLSLKNAIEFREKVISTEVMLTQGKPVCNKSAVEIELASTETDQRTSVPDWKSELAPFNMEEEYDEEYTQYEDIYDEPSTTTRSPYSNRMDIEILDTSDEDFNIARADDPLSVARGTKILNELISEFTGQDKVKPERSKNEIKAENPTKERTKPRKMKIQARLQDDDDDDSQLIIFGSFEKKKKLSPIKSSKRSSFKRSFNAS
ncbi:uncharacterized protein LOC111065879 isoform X2 [Drosophila obscura]|uniref:uncharacterized protein LOC111065879 isoform X2 n=1 Tax=Drosophila obscura TaxID=7282 RepID=UPI001BB233FE|nr:uncharacterized protein LOC111065879 isoform X2 [Drosophila obscura]